MTRLTRLALKMFIFSLFFHGCNPEKTKKSYENTLFTLLTSEASGIKFVNKIENKKDFNIFKYRNFYNGGGVALGDINNDGLVDIYFTGNMVSNRLYLNQGNLQFIDITIPAGVGGNKPWSTGVTMVDINADGFLDIYVSNAGNLDGNNHDNDLYINNGDLTFTEKANDYNLAKTGFSTQAAFFDYDNDGDLDAYILNNSNIPVSSLGYSEKRKVRAQNWKNVPDIFKGVGDLLLRNDGNTFVDVSEEAGIYGSLIGFGLGVLASDINNDNYIDIYVSNDFYERDYLYINNKDGTFSEEIKKWTQHLSLSAMGIDIADINNDGNADIFITDMLPKEEERVKSVMEFEGYNIFKLKQKKDFYQQYIQNTLQVNNGNGSFSEIAYFSGVDATDWSWAGLLVDLDNDGFRDIFITNGINHDLTDLDFVDFFANEIIQKMALTGRRESIDSIIKKMPVRPQPNFAFKNNQNLKFKNVNNEWGFDLPTMSNGAAYGDLDNDGDLDLVINNVNDRAYLYQNNSNKKTKHNYIRLQFQGQKENTFAIGTKVKLYVKDQIISQELIPTRGFQSSIDYTMSIGLGTHSIIDSMLVVWPDNHQTKIDSIIVNKTMILKQSEASPPFFKQTSKPHLSFLSSLENKLLVAEENVYNDFDFEGLLYRKLSQEGPTIAIGDINADGHEDVFVGGAKGQEANIYLHLGNGELKLFRQKVFEDEIRYEDTASAFFDVDQDGDLDLIVGSGGNEVINQREYYTRLYFNDGNGLFSKSNSTLPTHFTNTSVIAPNDFDQDGDIDVFIGSRSVVGVYGVSPSHLLLSNEGDGTFTNATDRLGYTLKSAGMVTDAKWIDVDGDGWEDLVTTADWGTPTFFKNKRGRLIKTSSSLDSIPGWWNSIAAADLDKDGDLDIILGNHGENVHYKPSKVNPLKMWINDFDNNGNIEQIVTQQKNGGDYPIHQMKELTSQLRTLKKKNLKASEYSKKTIHELFDPQVIENTIVKEIQYSQTMLGINEGEGLFGFKQLPHQVQFSSINAIECFDVNHDGNLDLIMAGNDFEYKPQFSRLDSSFGTLLLGDGAMNFNWQNYNRSGFFIREEVKGLKIFKDKKGNSYIFASLNNHAPKSYRINE